MVNVSKAVISTLIRNDIETVFGIPGTQSLPLNEAIAQTDRVRFVMARHETAVSHQAWGYAESSGRMAATVVIPGPGDMNAMNGLKNALNDCTPMLHIAVETEPHFRGGDAIHETPPDTYDNVVKENITVSEPENTIVTLERAIAVSRSPPYGPVRVGIPKNFLVEEIPLTQVSPFDRTTVTAPPTDAIRDAADLLAEADDPIIIAGGGIRVANATTQLRTVAEQLGAPVVPTYKGKGVFPEDHELFAGIMCVGSSEHLHRCVRGSDVALAVGTDLDVVTTQGWSFDLPDQLIHITVEEEDIGVGYDPEIGIVADAAASLHALKDAIGDISPTDGIRRATDVRKGDAELMADVISVTEPPLTSAAAEAALNDAIPDDGIFALDAGGFRIWGLHVLEVRGDRQIIDSGSWASMGVSLPAAIGAKLANPDRPVVAVVGGGGLLMCMQELHTIATEDIPVIIFVMNNNDYATISAEAAENFQLRDGEYEWADTPIRFTDIASALGVEAERARTPDQIRSVVTRAVEHNEPMLIEVPTDPREPQAKPLQ